MIELKEYLSEELTTSRRKLSYERRRQEISLVKTGKYSNEYQLGFMEGKATAYENMKDKLKELFKKSSNKEVGLNLVDEINELQNQGYSAERVISYLKKVYSD